MKRRDFLKTVAMLGSSVGVANPACGAPERSDASAAVATPLPKQVQCQDFELGLVYHFDLDVYMPGGFLRRMPPSRASRRRTNAALSKARPVRSYRGNNAACSAPRPSAVNALYAP